MSLKHETAVEAAEQNKYQSQLRQKARSLAAREIGPLPAVEDPARKEACSRDLKLFLETYFPATFRNPWSRAHEELIADLQRCILYGQSSLAVLPRGFGKSSIVSLAALWALFFGYRNYAVIVAASSTHAKRILQNLKAEIMFNPLLACDCNGDTQTSEYKVRGDFPEIVLPFRRIGNAAQKQGSQILNGELTRCQTSADRLVFPTVPGSKASGSVVQCVGFNGSIRGLNMATSKGNLRPDLLLLDDVQSDKSAKNPRRVQDQLATLNGAMKGLSSVDSTIATLACLTVIESNDLAELLMKSPEWRSTCYGVIDKLPGDKSMEKWAELNTLQGQLIEEGLSDPEIAERLNAEFEANKELLVDGCTPTWDSFKDPLDCHSMQKIMRLLFRDFNVFVREYMNKPSLAANLSMEQLTPEQLAKKIVKGYARGKIPLETEYLTLGCDSQTLGLFWTLMAHSPDGSAHVVDFGKYPKSLKKTLPQQYGGATLEQSIYMGYKDLLSDLMNRKYIRPDGLELQISKAVLDCSHGPTSLKIQQFIRDFGGPRVQPLFGRAKSPDEMVFGKKKPGELRGKGWSMPPVKRVKGADGKYISMPRHVICDVNSWKSSLRAGLQASPGVPGSITLFYDSIQNYNEFFNHLTSEKSSPLTGKFGTIDMWKLIPNRQNHWLDTTVYAYSAGSMVSKTGAPTVGSSPRTEQQFQTRKRIRLSEVQAQRGGY